MNAQLHDTIDELYVLIKEDATHTSRCAMLLAFSKGNKEYTPCDCWKARAMTLLARLKGVNL